MRAPGTVASPASTTSGRMPSVVEASWVSAAALRATATTGAPASAKATAIPRPRPRLAPTTIVVRLDRSLMTCSSVLWPPCSCLNPHCLDGRRVLPLERLYRAVAPALRHCRRHRVGKDLLLAVRGSVEDRARDGGRGGLGDVPFADHRSEER